MFASEAASLIDSTQNVINSWINNGLNLANHAQAKKQFQLQQKAFEWQKFYDQNQTQIRVDDMAKAGLNPILAAGSAGATGVSGVSASPSTPSSPSQGNLSSLVETLMQKEQLKQQAALAREANQTAKDVAETKAESDEKIAELNAATSASNAALNAQTQTQIATANNDALKDVRSAQSRYDNAMSDKQEFENEFVRQYNKLTGRLHSSKSVIEFLDNGATSVAAWLGTSVDFAKKFIKNAKKMAKKGITDLSQIDLSKVEWE
ncbi:MAG: hypothetical protein K2F89_09620 [Treponemataceae bacterium]|nr:hypothetical protein [Treponemataceae bacterium]